MGKAVRITGKTVGIGHQDFEQIIKNDIFYIDKTDFIREWWENKDAVTLITRPRRFGKTLNLSMLECFFSTKYAGRKDLFEGLSIWDNEEYRVLQGTYPVIFISFAGVKADNIKDAKNGIINAIASAYEAHKYLKESDVLNKEEKRNFEVLQNYSINLFASKKIAETTITASVRTLSMYLERYYGKKVLILLDEYDTPLQEAYVYGYWDGLVTYIRGLFNLAFKTNPYLNRAIMTGITRVSKESIFSDLNNLEVVTTTSSMYSTAFGFTESEVFAALDREGAGQREEVKQWYDGFTFGQCKDIYNPWSIINFLKERIVATYWADTSSNKLVSVLVREGTPDLKMQMEDLLAGNCLEEVLDEQVVFDQLRSTRGAVWSLLMASGYLKPVDRHFNHDTGKYLYKLKITNYETKIMFKNMISGWFPESLISYSYFREALIAGDIGYMNQFMNEISEEIFSTFDTGRKPSERTHPERFYHGFVLGLVVDLAGRYHIRSNRESGLGRYDVMMEPVNLEDNAIIIEFKVFSPYKDGTLKKAVEDALRQIEDKKYDTELISRGIPKEKIKHYGFAFDGKRVLIGE